MTIIEALVQLRNDLKLWVTNNLRVKVDKEEGKGLSSNDFTTEEKTKLGKLSIDDNNLLVSNKYTLGDTVSYFKTGYRYRKTYTFPQEESQTYYITLQNHYGNSEQRYNIDALCNNAGNRIFFTVNARPYMKASIYGKTLDYNSRDITSVAVYQNEYYHDLVVTVITKPTATTTIDIYSDGNFELSESCVSTTAPTGTKECEYIITTEDTMFSTAPIVADGKVMSTNDYTTEEKEKLAGLDVVDNLITDSATRPLSAAQGKALKTAIDSISTDIGDLGGGDMMKATYDTNGNGIVDNAERLAGHDASYFVTTDQFMKQYDQCIIHDSQLNATTLCFSIEGDGTSSNTRYPLTLNVATQNRWSGNFQLNVKLINGAPLTNTFMYYGNLPPIVSFKYVTNDNITTYMLQFDSNYYLWGHALVGCYPNFKFTDMPNEVLESGTELTASYGVTCNDIGALPSVLNSNHYGDTLPAAGNAGRIFFKKVSS